MPALRIGIVGAGFGARVHLPALASLPGVMVTVLADSGSGRAAAGSPGARAVSGWAELVEADDVEAVVVAVPPAVQGQVVHAALAAGKPVLCEKPFGITATEALAMEEQRRIAGLVGAIGFQFRFEPHLASLRREIAQGRIGKVQSISLSWLTAGRADPGLPWSWQNDAAQGGGVVNAFASHAVDLLSWLSGLAIERVERAVTAIVVDRRPDGAGELRPVTAEDQVEADLVLAEGATARLSICNCRADGNGMVIRVDGEDGILMAGQRPPFRAEDAWLHLEQDGVRRGLPFPAATVVPAGFDGRFAPVRALVQRFVAALRGKDAPDLPLFVDGLAARRILDALTSGVGSFPSSTA